MARTLTRDEALRAYEECFEQYVLSEDAEQRNPEAFGLRATLEAQLRDLSAYITRDDRSAIEAAVWREILAESEVWDDFGGAL